MHPPRSVLGELDARFKAMKEQGLRRTWEDGAPRKGASFVSNDYLGLAGDPDWRRTVAGCFADHAPSSSGSRLAAGGSEELEEAEQALADYFGDEGHECVLLPSGYQGNLAIVSAFVTKNRPVLVDKRIHASVAHALAASGARILPFAHGDLEHLDRRLREAGFGVQPVVFVESLYGMDGDVTDAAALMALRRVFDFFLVVDEAHALGCLGPGGRGVFAGRVKGPDVVLGTLGKALGLFGAFALVPPSTSEIFEQIASPVMHSTAPSPAHAAAVSKLVELLPKLSARRRRLAANARRLRKLLAENGVESRGDAHIVSIPVGDERRAARCALSMDRRRMPVLAARHPTVPMGQATLRLSVTASHAPEQLERAAAALGEIFRRRCPC